MQKFKLEAILAIVLATIAIILILWNLRPVSKSIEIVPGPTILVNAECEDDTQCIQGRNCFDDRCTQIIS